MKKFCPSTLVGLLFCLATLSGLAQQKPEWTVYGKLQRSGFEFDPRTGLFSGGVVVSNAMAALSADSALINYETGEVKAEGSVTIFATNHIWRGTNLTYNFITGQMTASNFKTGHNPFFISGQGLNATTNKIFSATDAVVTTDDYAEPAYKIRARHIIISPGQFFEAYDATFMLGNVPVFYLPHYKRSLYRHPNNYVLFPGYRGSFGPFLLNRYNWFVSDDLNGDVRLDWRQRRGFAGGPDLNYNLGQFGAGTAGYYYAHDEDPNAGLNIAEIPTDRHRATFAHQANVTSNLNAKVLANYQSDPQVARDFFESEYRKDVQPKSFGEVTHLWDNFVLDVLAQPQLIDFYETVERLPDVKLTGLRQQVGATPVFYESESSFGYFRRQFSSTNVLDQNYSAGRGDTFHQFLLPQTYFGWLNAVPRVGGRATYYTEVSGPATATASTNEQVRGVFNTGMEVSTKASRVWRNAESKFWDVNGLRHIIEPSVNYVFVPEPTRRPPELPQFDYEYPTLRLLPIDFPDYNSIDSIDSQNVMRLALRNRLQTKRENDIQNLVGWAVYTDWRIDPNENQSQFSDVYSELDLRPRSWMVINSQLRYFTDQGLLRESYNRLLIQPNDTWSFSVSHRYLMNNDPEFTPPEPGNNTFTTSLYYKMNENWAARIAQRFEAQDGTLEEQWYSIYRDLRSWTAALTLRIRDNRDYGPDDFTVGVSFSLKAFPRFGLGSDTDRPSTLIGG